MRIAIIGAGFAGLAAGKVLDQFGHDVTIYEKCPDVGGVWSRTRRYPGLSTQNDKGTYHLSDLPMPRDYPEWPSGAQVQAYLESYAAKFNLVGKLRLNTEVLSATLDESGANPTWTVTSRDVAGSEEVKTYNGIFSTPSIPTFSGQDDFVAAGGRICAPSDVHGLEEVKGKDVLVVGYGKSSCDIAAAIAGDAKSTSVIARQLIWKMPKKIKGVLNFKYLMLTRMGEALFEYQTLRGMEKFMHGPGKGVRNGMLGSLQSVATSQLKLKQHDLVPHGDFERIARSTVSLTTDGFYELVDQGKLKVVRDAQITALKVVDGAKVAELSDGSTRPVDVVICGTGWRQQVPFLSEEIQDRITDERGNFELYRFILPHDVPGLTFCGYNSSFFSPLSAEVAALWIACHLDGSASIPSVEERRQEVAARLRWMEERTEGHHARGTNLIPFSMHNIDECLREIGAPMGAGTRAGEWLMPIDPSKYQRITKALMARRGASAR